MSVRKLKTPILLNYTGEKIKIILEKNDNRFKCQTGNLLLLPPLGTPTIEIVSSKAPGEVFYTETHIVRGIPVPMDGVYYIVQDHIAKLLYGIRKDLLILHNKSVESSKNMLKLDEMMLVGDDLSYFIVDFETI